VRYVMVVRRGLVRGGLRKRLAGRPCGKLSIPPYRRDRPRSTGALRELSRTVEETGAPSESARRPGGSRASGFADKPRSGSRRSKRPCGPAPFTLETTIRLEMPSAVPLRTAIAQHDRPGVATTVSLPATRLYRAAGP